MYVCEICGKEYARESNLRRHMESHVSVEAEITDGDVQVGGSDVMQALLDEIRALRSEVNELRSKVAVAQEFVDAEKRKADEEAAARKRAVERISEIRMKIMGEEKIPVRGIEEDIVVSAYGLSMRVPAGQEMMLPKTLASIFQDVVRNHRRGKDFEQNARLENAASRMGSVDELRRYGGE